MSSNDFEYNFSSYDESSTDDEYEEALEALKREKQRDCQAHQLWDLMLEFNIMSPLNGPLDGYALNDCLYNSLDLRDVISDDNRLKYRNKVALGGHITNERIEQFIEVARGMAQLYSPEMSKFTSYIHSVTAGLLRYHYRL